MLPPVMLFCIVGALVFRSAMCAAFVTLTLAAWLLPPGKVWPSRSSHLATNRKPDGMQYWPVNVHEAPSRRTLKVSAVQCQHPLDYDQIEAHRGCIEGQEG